MFLPTTYGVASIEWVNCKCRHVMCNASIVLDNYIFLQVFLVFSADLLKLTISQLLLWLKWISIYICTEKASK